METNTENKTWEQVETENAKKIRNPRAHHLALEILEQEHRVSKAKDLGIVGLSVAVIVIAIGLSIINYQNDCDWRDFVENNKIITQNME